MEHGDVVLFHTDGLFEVEDGEGRQLGVDGLVECVRTLVDLPLCGLVEETVSAVQTYATHGFDDDVCLLGVEMTGGGKDEA